MSILGERFFKMSNAVFCYDLTPIQLAVYSYLVCLTGQSERCWPSMKTIAACCGCSKNAAREATKVLEKRRFIKKVSGVASHARPTIPTISSTCRRFRHPLPKWNTGRAQQMVGK